MAGFTREKTKIYKYDYHGDKVLAIDLDPFSKFRGSTSINPSDNLLQMRLADRHRYMVKSLFGTPGQLGIADILTGGLFQLWYHGLIAVPDDTKHIFARRLTGILTSPFAGAIFIIKAVTTGLMYIPGLIATVIGHGAAKIREHKYLREVSNLVVKPNYEKSEQDSTAASRFQQGITNIYNKRQAYHSDRFHDFYRDLSALDEVESATIEDNHLVLTLNSKILSEIKHFQSGSAYQDYHTQTGKIAINLNNPKEQKAFKALVRLNIFKVDKALEDYHMTADEIITHTKKT